jgi:hypothetical protein
MWWKKLFELVQDVFDLRRQLKGHDKRLDEYSLVQENLNLKVSQLADRVLRLELELQHQKEQHARERAHWQERQAAEREHFRLQLENLILRAQRGLPLPEQSRLPAEPMHQPDEPSLDKQEE